MVLEGAGRVIFRDLRCRAVSQCLAGVVFLTQPPAFRHALPPCCAPSAAAVGGSGGFLQAARLTPRASVFRALRFTFIMLILLFDIAFARAIATLLHQLSATRLSAFASYRLLPFFPAPYADMVSFTCCRQQSLIFAAPSRLTTAFYMIIFRHIAITFAAIICFAFEAIRHY